jgi:hypothetical protein
VEGEEHVEASPRNGYSLLGTNGYSLLGTYFHDTTLLTLVGDILSQHFCETLCGSGLVFFSCAR